MIVDEQGNKLRALVIQIYERLKGLPGISL